MLLLLVLLKQSTRVGAVFLLFFFLVVYGLRWSWLDYEVLKQKLILVSEESFYENSCVLIMIYLNAPPRYLLLFVFVSGLGFPFFFV